MMTHKKLGKYSVLAWAIGLVSLPVFLFFSLPEYSYSNRLLAWGLFALCIIPIINYIKQPKEVPILALVLLNYIIFFAIPLFHEQELAILAGHILPKPEIINTVLFLTILAVLSIQAGYWFAKRVLLRQGSLLPKLKLLNCSEKKLYYFGLASIVGSLLSSQMLSLPIIIARPFAVIFSADLGVALLSFLYYRNSLRRPQKRVVLLVLSVLILLGIASGSTQNLVQPLVIWLLCRWLVIGGVPIRSMVAVIAIVLLVQPVKLEYRTIAWFDDSSQLQSTYEKVKYFSEVFISHWFKEETQQYETDKLGGASRRLSLLLITAHVVEWTPEIVPYQYGQTLMYMIYTWIPRFIWPDKPIAQQANIDVARNYGIAGERALEKTRYGLGHIGEVFINFGGWGIIPIFFIIGIFYYIPIYLVQVNIRRSLNQDVSEKVWQYWNTLPFGQQIEVAPLAILVAVLVNIMVIGSTIGNVFGSVIQQVILQSLLINFLSKRSRIYSK